MLVSTIGVPSTSVVTGTGVSHGGKTCVGAAMLLSYIYIIELRIAQGGAVRCQLKRMCAKKQLFRKS